MDKINEICYYGTENYSKYKYLYMLDQESNILKEISREDELVEKFKNEVERLNSDLEFVWGLTGEEDAEKMQRSLISLKAKEAENKQMIKIAKNLIKEKMSLDFIVRNTGLSEEQVKLLMK